MTDQIKYADLQALTARYADEIHEAVNRVVDSGWYLRGKETAAFEHDFAQYIGTRHCIGCGNGLDALTLMLRAYREMGVMEQGDEVIVPANTFVATILSITENGLVPVLVEPKIETFQIDDELIEPLITPRTRAIMLVHLYGRCACTEKILSLCSKYNLRLLEDNAQGHGCEYRGQKTGSLGDAAAHSFYPTKNLGALGDAGAVTTNDDALAATVRRIANYGSSVHYVFDTVGRNSRIDEMQAAVLSVKLRHLDEDNRVRRQLARRYIDEVANDSIVTPSADYWQHSVFHIFPILSERRDELRVYLRQNGVQTEIHYPIPPHRQKCYAYMNQMQLPVTETIHECELSLPLSVTLTAAQQDRIIRLLNEFK